jgi:hypothetical protein
MAACLSVGGLPMCGCTAGAEMSVSTSEVWSAYCRYVARQAGGAQVSVLPAVWALNGVSWAGEVLPFSGMPVPFFLRVGSAAP